MTEPVFRTGSKLQGIILYNHPTALNRSSAPSFLGEEYKVIGGLYGAMGYAVVFPDYVGYQPGVVHPYVLFPKQTVQSGILALNQAWSFYESKN